MSAILTGFDTALSLTNIYYCLLGVSIGTAVGVLPGIGSIAAMSLLFPFTFYLDPLPALIMLAGIYYGSEYGGSTAAILLNLPGTPSSAVTAIDGYQMAQQGRAGVALFVTTIASFCGGTIGILVLTFLAGTISQLGLAFGSAEYFAVVIFGLVAASAAGNEFPLRGLAAMLLGILLGTVGLDSNTALARFTFGIHNLRGGIELVPLVMGIFGVATVIMFSSNAMKRAEVGPVSMQSLIPSRTDMRRSVLPIVRGAVAGSVLGALPGTGTTMAAFVAHGFEKFFRQTGTPVGKGAVEGVAAPEAANNAAAQTAFVPTLTLGIPGSPSLAIIFGVLVINGITPGPLLIDQRPDVFWGLIASFWLGNLALVALNLPLVGIWVKLLQVPYRLLFPLIIALVCIGTYSVNNNPFDVWMVMAFGALGMVLMLLHFPTAPLLLGFVLGPLAELHFRNAMSVSGGSLTGLAHSPISTGALLATLGLLAFVALATVRRLVLARKARPEAPA